MAIEKGIVVEESKPQNVNGEAIEIEIVNPESVGIETEDGGMEINFGEETSGLESGFGENLAEYIEDSELALIGNDILDNFTSDKDSRSEWEETYVKGLDQLGLKY